MSALFALSSYSMAAEEPKLPTAWRGTNVTQSRICRINVATSALQEAMDMLNQTDGQFHNGTYADAGVLYAQMVEFDRLTNHTKYKHKLKHYFKATLSNKSGFLDHQVISIYNECFPATDFRMIAAGWAAYKTYNDSEFLEYAEASWASARRYTISQEQAMLGTIETKNFTLATCNETLAGGTYSVSHALQEDLRN
ncbi:hypothetical protein IW261DRAFT_1612199 [Armillaria novae-zelandiae]|uniref:Uncharacterized protein n=1 Tax=Armillaria novae-zelandiae TaxID=153914 RepID=A0AA39NTA7_9AGAR|nr:hypothetical protein IW261DRAFT_1612199 [Armillaria novae-zelandiae]